MNTNSSKKIPHFRTNQELMDILNNKKLWKEIDLSNPETAQKNFDEARIAHEEYKELTKNYSELDHKEILLNLEKIIEGTQILKKMLETKKSELPHELIRVVAK